MWKAFFTEIFVPQSVSCLREKQTARSLLYDCLAGLSMGAFCFPLAIAFAIATGVDPVRGIYAAVVGGLLISIFSGSRVQIGGPAGTLAIVSLLIVEKEGLDGLMMATLLAGILLIFFGVTRLGSLIKYIPDTVTIAYSTGVALMIFTSQMHDLFGLQPERSAAHFGEKWFLFFQSIGTFHLPSFFIGVTSLLTLIAFRVWAPRLPGAIFALILGALFVALFRFDVETIGSRFGEFSSAFPQFTLPHFSLTKAKLVFHDSVMLAVLIAIESIIASVVTSSMIGQKARCDCELIAQGLANIASVLFCGIPCCGSLSRASTNVKYGARTPLAGIFHALFMGIMLWGLASLIGYIPIPTVAAILMMLGWNMLELGQIVKFLKAPRSDAIVFGLVFFLILFVDVTVGFEVGIVLSTSLFIKRMSENEHAVKFSEVFSDPSGNLLDPEFIDKSRVPDRVEVLEINGPFFYGIVERFKEMMDKVRNSPKVFILRMRKVPFIDATAIRAIYDLHDKCKKQGKILILSGVTSSVREELRHLGVEKKIGTEAIFPNIDTALCHIRLMFEKEAAEKESALKDASLAVTPTITPIEVQSELQSDILSETSSDLQVAGDLLKENFITTSVLSSTAPSSTPDTELPPSQT